MIEGDYTAAGGIGTLTVRTDEPEFAAVLRRAYSEMQKIVAAGGTPSLTVSAG